MALPYIVFPLLMSRFLESSRERKYYKITGSPMSLSSIIYYVFFEGYGPVKSCFRRLILIGLVLCFRLQFFADDLFYLPANAFFYLPAEHNLAFYDFIFVCWAVLFPFSDVFKNNETSPFGDSVSLITETVSTCTRYLQDYVGYDVEDVFVSESDYENIVNIFSILLNFKCWQKNLKTFFNKEKLGFARKCWYYFKAVLFSFVYIVGISFILLLLIMFTFPFCYFTFFFRLLIMKRQRISHRVWDWIKVFHAAFLTFSIFISFLLLFLYLPYITLLFFTGLILNAVYFSSYVTSITILIFYSWAFWQDIETKYSTLKMQIYEVCKDSGLTYAPDDGDNIPLDGDNIYFDSDKISFDGYRRMPDDSVVGNNNGNDDNHHSNRLKSMTIWEYNSNNEPMISRQFYDRIREKVLPYNLILFNFFIKVFFVCLFAFFLFTIVRILNTADISGTVKVITTMSMSVVPYIFNVVAAKNSEEEKKVQKIQVEKLVSEGTDQVYQIYMKMSDDEI